MPKEPQTPTTPPKEPAPGSLAEDIASAVAGMEALNMVEDPASVIPEGFDPLKVQSIGDAREAAKIPEHKKASQLIGRPVVFVSWRPQRGFLASTGEYRPGMFCVIMDVETRKVSTVWIGQVALYKELTKIKPPFRATIQQSGRTLVFS
jgi:hypothetical protein